MNVGNLGALGAGGMHGRKGSIGMKMEMPKEIYVLRRDKMRNYYRFNKKFEDKFGVVLEMFNNFKKLQEARFQDGTKMQLELSLEFN